MLSIKEYQTVANISGPLMLVEMVDEAKYGKTTKFLSRSSREHVASTSVAARFGF